MDKYGIGIIGCGTIASVHLDAIRSYEGAVLKMVCDIDEALVGKVAEKEACEWVKDYDLLLNNDEIEIIHILTPHYLHVEMAIKALKAGKHVVLEKPVGTRVDDLEKLNIVAKASDKTIGVTLQNRFNPTVRKMKEVIATGQLGELIASKGLLTWCRKDGYYLDSPWRGSWGTEGGGLLINQAIHTLDLMVYVGGPLKDMKATVQNLSHPYIEVEDTASITLNYENGAIGHFFGTNSYGMNSPVELGFVFEKGTLEVKNDQLYLVTDQSTEVIANDLPKAGEKSYWGVSHQEIIHDIYNSIRAGKSPQVTIQDGINATKLVLACYK